MSGLVRGQQNPSDSLRNSIGRQKEDTTEVNALIDLALEQQEFDSRIIYAQQGLSLAKKIDYAKGQADCLLIIGQSIGMLKKLGSSIQYALEAMKVYEGLKEHTGIVESCIVLENIYREARDYRKSLTYAFYAVEMAEANNVIGRKFSFPGVRLGPMFDAEIAQTYILMDKLDSALFFSQKAINEKLMMNGYEWNFPIYLEATYQGMKGDYVSALANYRIAKELAPKNGFSRDTLQIGSGMANLFIKMGKPDSALYYGQGVVRAWTPESEIKTLLESNNAVAQAYKLKSNADSSLKYTEITHALKDSMFSKEKDRELQRIAFNEELKQQELITTQEKYKRRVQLIALSSGLFILVLLSIILWRNNRQKQKARNKIERAYKELKSAQAQLIQSEKMASLGELTAGIAHEIQNPLNFVNNFSEVNTELIDELEQEVGKGNMEAAKTIAKDIKENEQKISHHGKRADAIVKGMLQHSRSSSGQKEPTDINTLADEYIRLCYHGLRAKDKSFNAAIKTEFDPGLEKINIVKQDLGRVILNLLTNAFYAVNEKKQMNSEASLPDGQRYEPTVSLTTKKTGNKVEIKIADNGNGIPQKVLSKIFQPFFTTKPTGQGTGLGLSLSYDIVKAHGGELKVGTKEGEGSEFIILLPV